MKNLFLITTFLFYAAITSTVAASSPYEKMLIEKIVISSKDTTKMKFVSDPVIYKERWDTLAQPRFWQKIMRLPSDSSLVNIAACRTPLHIIDTRFWFSQNEEEKLCYKENLCVNNSLTINTPIFITTGKREFYEIKKTLPKINTAIDIFVKNNVDPWYAQTILLIESPGKLHAKSTVGAYGPFQLMRSVAIKQGLIVNKSRDERSDLAKSAKAAAKFINNTCIPNIKSSLDKYGIKYTETDIWFRLLVLHAYHAGSANVAGVIGATGMNTGGMELITKIWQTEYRTFKNQSQNYSQIALAALISLDEIINQYNDTVFLVQGDRMMSQYKKIKDPDEAAIWLQKTISFYEDDLVDGMINIDYFISKVKNLQTELINLADKNKGKLIYTNVKYPDNELRLISMGNQLLRKRESDAAIKLMKFNINSFPASADTYDVLSRAYKMNGNKMMSEKYAGISMAIGRNDRKGFD
jgi:hypothetical protein